MVNWLSEELLGAWNVIVQDVNGRKGEDGEKLQVLAVTSTPCGLVVPTAGKILLVTATVERFVTVTLLVAPPSSKASGLGITSRVACIMVIFTAV
ncbi:hypothetical protein B6N58_00240 [Legionella micdadei]|nr:hypothetical protein B6N58_00240 [Legionella micdadei]